MTISAAAPAGPAVRRNGDNDLLTAGLLAFGVVGFEQLLHTGPGGPPVYQALHWLSDSTMALPLALLAVGLGTRLSSRNGRVRRDRADVLARALLIAVVFAVLLIPGGIAHEQIDNLTHSHAAISVHTHGGIPATRDLRDPAVLAAYVLHAFSDGLTGQLVGVPLLLAALAWMARRRTRTNVSTRPGALPRERMTFAS